MPHDTPLIATIVGGIGLAFIFGTIASRLRIPPLVGYLVAGVLVGPHTPGFVADQSLAPELAEMGVILLMFGVGLHFSLKDLLSVRAIAVPGAVVQIAIATVMGSALAWALGWSIEAGFVFGLALSTASTVVLLRALQERRMIDTEKGRIAVGWLIVEDLAMVLALVLLPALATMLTAGDGAPGVPPGTNFVTVLGITLLKVVAFVAFMLIVGRRVIPWVLHYVAHTGSRELFRLAVFAIALGVAFGAAKLFGVSLALGAFFAGMILSESELSHRAAEETLPLRDAFAVLFFVSVGMMFDPMSLVNEPWPVLATLLIIIIGKSVGAFFIVLAFGYPIATALAISASLAQIGEFSFILAGLGVGLDLLPEQGRDLILAGAILSILLNPVAFAAIAWLRPRLERNAILSSMAGTKSVPQITPDMVQNAQSEENTVTEKTGHTILVGYGRVGTLVGEALLGTGLPYLVIEDSEKTVFALRDKGIETIAGNAAKADLLRSANLAEAQRVIIAIPNAFEAGQIVQQAKAANPIVEVIARAHSDAEVQYLTDLGANSVIMGEREIARAIIERVIAEPEAIAADISTVADGSVEPEDRGEKPLGREAGAA